MNNFLLGLLVFVAYSYAGACAAPYNEAPAEAVQALESADEVTLYSLEVGGTRQKSIERFYRYPVLGTVRLNSEEAREAAQAFLTALNKGGRASLCFNPRHAIRIVLNGHTYDYLLCYECDGEVIIKDGGQVLGSVLASGSPAILNNILAKHHIQLSPQ